MIKIQRANEPEILKIKGKNKRRALCDTYTRYQQDYDSGQRKFRFDNKVYAHQSVKQTLKTMQHNKCCFCESKFSHIAYGDVEHFRPKAGYKQNQQDTLHKPSYYWLAYQWDNLLLSCQICNQRYKKNLFPLLNPTVRARNHQDSIEDETPLLINPTKVNPEDYISFRQEVAYSIDDNPYGEVSIDGLGLNRTELEEKRREKLNILLRLFDILLQSQRFPDDVKLQDIAKDIKPIINDMIAPQAEYSAMTKAAIT